MLQNFYSTWVLGVACQKQRLGTKLEGAELGSIQKKFGTPYLFLQPLKLATSNFVRKLGMGLAYQKGRLRPKLAAVWARGASKKLGTLHIFATVEASNFKFGTQIGLGTSVYQKTTFSRPYQNWRVSGLG